MNRLLRRLMMKFERLEERVNQLGQYHTGTVTAVNTSPARMDVRLFRSTDEGTVVLSDLPYYYSGAAVSDVVIVLEWGNGHMEDGSGAFSVLGKRQ